MSYAGQRLRTLREELGLTIRDVAAASLRIAAKHENQNFALSLSRISDIETKGILPNIYRLYSLSIIYHRDYRELLAWYGIDLSEAASDFSAVEIPRSHRSTVLDTAALVQVPVKLDPGFDLRRTLNMGRMIEEWGLVPLSYLARFANSNYTYGYVGSEDYTMYPIVLPGSFVQIDENNNRVQDSMWRSEYERPIYFVETREGYVCCWCAVEGGQIVLQPHPLSPVPVRVLRHPQEAEVIGQVVAVAMRLVNASDHLPAAHNGSRRMN